MSTKDRIEQELNEIMEEHDGVLHPAHVVAFAKDPQTALHSRFEWDDTAAAEQYRLVQARQLIRVYVEVAEDSVTEIRAFVSLPSDRETGGGYRKTTTVMSDAERRAELIRTALRELATFKRKYAALQEFSKVFAAVDEVKVETKTTRKRSRRAG